MTQAIRVGRGHLALFVSSYAVQGVVAAYLFTSNAIYLTSAGVARETAADVQTLALMPFERFRWSALTVLVRPGALRLLEFMDVMHLVPRVGG